ncbi:MAG: hypothetical protein R3C45_18295 [Phycisphaerales bacterium]
MSLPLIRAPDSHPDALAVGVKQLFVNRQGDFLAAEFDGLARAVIVAAAGGQQA